jgi:hypothetical protein
MCAVTDCGLPRLARGLCSKHYCRWKNHGTTDRHPMFSERACSVTSCTTAATRKGLCGMHYARLRSTGTTTDPANRQRARCTVCNEPAKGHGLCTRHLQTSKRNGHPLAVAPLIPYVCLSCGKAGESKRANTKHCSYKCAGETRRGRPAYKSCVVCAATFRASETAKTCSPQCLKEAAKRTAAKWAFDQQTNVAYLQRRRMVQQRRRARIASLPAEHFSYVEIAERDGLCGSAVPHDARHPHDLSGTIDHTVPIAKGGPHTKANVRLAHLSCNRLKGVRTFVSV